MGTVILSPYDIALAATLVCVLALTSVWLQLRVAGTMMISMVRMMVQLLLVGLVLKTLFSHATPLWVAGMACVMLLMAGREVTARQRRRLTHWWSFGIGTVAMSLSGFTVCVLALRVMVQPTPWYSPQYAIPMLGMILGNTMNGVSLGIDRVTRGAWEQRDVIEARLAAGESWREAFGGVARDSVRTALIPILNSMAAAGVVSLPGMMTGQILGGNPPVEAVKYQILIFLLIAAATGAGAMLAVALTARRLFDGRHRLRVDRLRAVTREP
jgi:putative ABC transport system permease protein